MNFKRKSLEIISILVITFLLIHPISLVTESSSSHLDLHGETTEVEIQGNDIPAVPDDFYGELTINEEPAPAGTELQARIDDEVVNDPEVFVTNEPGYYGDREAVPRRYLTVQAYEKDIGEPIEFFIKHEGEWIKATRTDPDNITFKGREVRNVDLHFETEPLIPTIESLYTKDVYTDRATLAMRYDIKNYDSVEIRFSWRKEFRQWQDTDWRETTESGTFTETITNLETDQRYEFSSEIKYNSEILKSETLFFKTPTEGNQPPTPEFTWAPSRPNEGQQVDFDASDSHDPDGEIEYYLWNFGDGQEGQGKKTEHTYDEPGTYSVSLEVIDDEGASAAISNSVTIYEISFSINDLSLNQDEIYVGETLEVTLVIQNTGRNTAVYEEDLYIKEGNDVIASERISKELSSGNVRSLSYTFTLEDEGEYTVMIGEEERNIRVLERDEEGINLMWVLIPVILIAIVVGWLIIKKKKVPNEDEGSKENIDEDDDEDTEDKSV